MPLCSDIFYVIAEMARTLNRGVVAERAKPTHALISFELLGRSRLASSKSPREFNECFFFDFPRAHDRIAESAFLVSCYAVVVTLPILQIVLGLLLAQYQRPLAGSRYECSSVFRPFLLPPPLFFFRHSLEYERKTHPLRVSQ